MLKVSACVSMQTFLEIRVLSENLPPVGCRLGEMEGVPVVVEGDMLGRAVVVVVVTWQDG